MSFGFNQYGSAALQAANTYGINPSIFMGLIQTESSWNASASPGTTSAYGLTQLTKGAAANVGVNRFDPIQNLNGGAAYLSKMLKATGGDYTKALAAYHDGLGAIGMHGGFDYAKTVVGDAAKYAGNSLLSTAESGLASTLDTLLPGAGDALRSALGLGTAAASAGGAGSSSDSSCGINPICYLQQWITDSEFFKRLSLAMVAFILLFAAFYLMNRPEINSAVKTAALA